MVSSEHSIHYLRCGYTASRKWVFGADTYDKKAMGGQVPYDRQGVLVQGR